MKKLFLLLVPLLLFAACSNDKEEAVNNITGEICSTLKQDNSPAGIMKAKDIYIKNFSSKFDLSKEEESEYLVKFRKCFANMGFTKEIKPFEQTIYGSAADYLTLKEKNLKIVLSNENAPAFSINMIFSGIKKYTDTAKLEIEGDIILLNNNKKALVKYNIYPVPDFYLTMQKGSGDFKFTAYLDAIWYPYGKNPFDTAAKYLSTIQKAEYYLLELNIKDKESKNKKNKEKNDQEILDNLQILSAPSN